jgi:hypothetical protein
VADAGTGLKWVGILIVYFILMTFIVTVIKMSVAGGEISSDLNFDKVVRCDDPREVYYPYSVEHNSTADMTSNNAIREGLSSIDCEMSIGVLSNASCSQIQGCTWQAPAPSFWEQFMWWRNTTEFPTCMGTFNTTYYDINTTTSPFFPALNSKIAVAAHNYSSLVNDVGSICSSPSVINNQTNCQLFSCTWGMNKRVSDVMMEQIKFDNSIGSNMWASIGELVSFRFDFGIDNEFISYFLNFFVFYLPLILLIGATSLLARGLLPW